MTISRLDCDNFEPLAAATRSLHVLGTPVDTDSPNNNPVIKRCLNLCGQVREDCAMAAGGHPEKEKYPNDPGERLMIGACEDLNTVFDVIINPYLTSFKLRMSMLAEKAKRTIQTTGVISEELADEYRGAMQSGIDVITERLEYTGVFVKARGDLIEIAFRDMIDHKIRGQLGTARLKMDTQLGRALKGNLTTEFVDHFDKVPLLHVDRNSKPEIELISASDIIDSSVYTIKPDDSVRVVKNLPEGTDTQMHFRGHKRIVMEIIVELIRNAAKAMPEGGKIQISAKRHDGNVVISVQDNGHGIPPEIIGKIFEHGFTTGAATGGTGKGLALAKHYIEKVLFGEIVAQNNPERGSTFSIVIPEAKLKTAHSPEQPARQVAVMQ